MNPEKQHLFAPPGWADRILKWFCAEEVLETFQGDLHELYYKRRSSQGKFKADFRFIADVLDAIRPFALKRNSGVNSNQTAMYRNYFKATWRGMLRHKTYTGINTLGLVLGISAFISIAIYIDDELKYDKFHPDFENTYRISAHIISNGQEYDEATCQFPLAAALQNDFSGIMSTVRLNRPYSLPLLQHGENKYVEDRFFYADQSFFEVFGFPLIKGDPENALVNPNSIVLTEKTAARYFGMEEPMGKLITLNKGSREYSLEVTGIAKEVSHSHLQFDMIVPMHFLLGDWERHYGLDGPEKKWFWTGTWTYVRFENDAAYKTVTEQLPQIVQKYFPPKWREGLLETDRIDKIHLHSNRLSEIEPNGSINQVRIFSSIAVVVLLIAVINFVNLMSAQGMDRARQVGVRKFLGAQKKDILQQFLLESTMLCYLAGAVAFLLTYFVLIPEINSVAGKTLDLTRYLTLGNLLLYFTGLTVLGVFAGIYPSILFSRFNALKILRGNLMLGRGGAWLRRSFVIIQFMASVVLIIAVVVINNQRKFIRSMDTGFDKENILVLEATNNTNERMDAFKNELLRVPGVTGVSGVLDVPGKGTSSIRFIPEGGTINDPQQLPITYVDENFLDVANVRMAKGRFFSKDHPSDFERGFIINEKAAQLLGWGDEAVGKRMEMFGPGSPEIEKRGEIIGVVRDFNFESLHHAIRPLVMIMHDSYDFFLVKYKGVEMSALINGLDKAWVQFDSKWPMQSFLMDQDLERLYDKEEKLTRVTNYGMSFALLIAFIGIYGLSSFLINKRTKEVGIRRVLGSTIGNILALLSRDFVRLVILANLLAWPLAWYLMDSWLENFQYSVSLSWMVFILATAISILLAMIAIAYHTIKVSRLNPVRSLRYE